jgi:hypothetical protein
MNVSPDFDGSKYNIERKNKRYPVHTEREKIGEEHKNR